MRKFEGVVGRFIVLTLLTMSAWPLPLKKTQLVGLKTLDAVLRFLLMYSLSSL
jgi:hypothetical protein